MTDTVPILEAHIGVGRRAIRARQATLDDLAERWHLDREALWTALATPGARPLAEPPLTPSEALAADPRNVALAMRGQPEIVPLRSGDKILCGVPGCGRPHRARGFCMAHFKRVGRDGDPQVDTPISGKPRPTGRVCATPGCGGAVLTRRVPLPAGQGGDLCARCFRNLRDRTRRARARDREVVFA
jgi:hypothetical protein